MTRFRTFPARRPASRHSATPPRAVR